MMRSAVRGADDLARPRDEPRGSSDGPASPPAEQQRCCAANVSLDESAVRQGVLRRWMRELTAAPGLAFPGNGQMRADQGEIAAPRKEVARLRAERDILQKAAAFFAREAI